MVMCDLADVGVRCPTVLPQDLKHHSATVASAVAAAVTNTTINKPAQEFTYLSQKRWLSRKLITGTRSMGFLMSF